MKFSKKLIKATRQEYLTDEDILRMPRNRKKALIHMGRILKVLEKNYGPVK